MATIAQTTGGAIRAVYDDRWHSILAAIGRPVIERASEVEYDADAQEWVATYRATGEVIARGPNRAEVIASEVRWIESNVIRQGQRK